MSYISRAQTPAAFADKTSDLLLLAPEPQYLYAALILSAIGMNLNAESGLSLLTPGRRRMTDCAMACGIAHAALWVALEGERRMST